MSESSRDLLRRLFLVGYDELKTRLTRHLGSAELAGDALQDTWLRLQGATPIGPVHHPVPYILRIAYNIARKRSMRDREMVTLDDARVALSLSDDEPDAAAVAESRSDITLLRQAVAELTPRRREILFASRLEGVPLAKLAVRYGISQRWVERELQQAVLHCAQRLDRKIVQRFGPKPRQGSDKSVMLKRDDNVTNPGEAGNLPAATRGPQDGGHV